MKTSFLHAFQLSVIASLCALPLAADAQESPQSAPLPSVGNEVPIHLLDDTAAVTDVPDAFDPGNNWSFRLTAGYTFQTRGALLEREVRGGTSTSGTTQLARVGNYREVTHTLNINAELALFHDLALTFGIPYIVSNTREIRGISDPAMGEGNAALFDGWTHNNAPTQLFGVNSPFQAPSRSGIDQVRLGISWAILNQQRDQTKPTWLVRFEWRPPVGSLLHACNANAPTGVEQCPDPRSVPSAPAGGTINSTGATTRPVSAGSPGISRGLHGIFFQTMLSRRMGYVEPYGGIEFLAEFPERSAPFRYFDTPYGLLANFPPISGTFTLGTEVIPWENRETWQRLVIDLRLRGTYHSQGRDYSAVYDALGTSTSRALAQPGCPSNVRSADGSCQPGREVYFDGTTSTASYATIGTSVSVSIQAARFLRFNLGGTFLFNTSHLITNTDACNPSTQPPADHPEWRGGCVSNSAPDPLHRPVIDAPGGRFRTSEDMQFELYASVALTPRFF